MYMDIHVSTDPTTFTRIANMARTVSLVTKTLASPGDTLIITDGWKRTASYSVHSVRPYNYECNCEFTANYFTEAGDPYIVTLAENKKMTCSEPYNS
jgi:hypothetical protein